jgi:hypothetical protein
MPQTIFTGARTVHLIRWITDDDHVTVVVGNIVVGDVTPAQAEEIRKGVYQVRRAFGMAGKDKVF